MFADEQVNWSDTHADGEVLWAVTDNLGSVRDVIDGDANLRIHRRFDGFGNIVDETHYNTSDTEVTTGQTGFVEEAFAFTGRYLDKDTGLQNNLNRWYDPKMGRWMSEDPINFAAGDANLYRYVGNSPVNSVDPTGLQHRPGYPPYNPPPPKGTRPIDQHPGTKDRVHDIKRNLTGDGVGPDSWVGIDPDDEIIVTNPNGSPEGLGPYQDYLPCDKLLPKPITDILINLPPVAVPVSPSPVPVPGIPPWWIRWPAFMTSPPLMVVPLPLIERFLPYDPRNPPRA